MATTRKQNNYVPARTYFGQRPPSMLYAARCATYRRTLKSALVCDVVSVDETLIVFDWGTSSRRRAGLADEGCQVPAQIGPAGRLSSGADEREPTISNLVDIERLFNRRRFDHEVIVLCVHWYQRYRLCLRDLVEIMAERRPSLAHTTIMRPVKRFAPKFIKVWSRFAKSAGRSWRVSETYMKVRDDVAIVKVQFGWDLVISISPGQRGMREIENPGLEFDILFPPPRWPLVEVDDLHSINYQGVRRFIRKDIQPHLPNLRTDKFLKDVTIAASL